jgi:hypothetical protein
MARSALRSRSDLWTPTDFCAPKHRRGVICGHPQRILQSGKGICGHPQGICGHPQGSSRPSRRTCVAAVAQAFGGVRRSGCGGALGVPCADTIPAVSNTPPLLPRRARTRRTACRAPNRSGCQRGMGRGSLSGQRMRRAIRDRPTGANLPGRADPSGRRYSPRRCMGVHGWSVGVHGWSRRCVDVQNGRGGGTASERLP